MTQRNHTSSSSSSSTPLTASLSIPYRNALRIIKVTVVKPTHMQSELTIIMTGRGLCWDGMKLLLLRCSEARSSAAVPVLTRFHCRCRLSCLITLLLTVCLSGGRLSHLNTPRLKKSSLINVRLKYCGKKRGLVVLLQDAVVLSYTVFVWLALFTIAYIADWANLFVCSFTQ